MIFFFFIVRNVSLGMLFGLPGGGGRENVYRFSADDAFALIGCYTVSVVQTVQDVDCVVSVCCAGRAVSSYQHGRAQAPSALLRKPESSVQIRAERRRRGWRASCL